MEYLQPIQRDKDGVHRIEWGSVEECMAMAMHDNAVNEKNKQLLIRVTEEYAGKDDFWDCKTQSQLRDMVHNPPEANLGEIESMRNQLDGVMQNVKPVRHIMRNQDHGDDLDTGAWARRDPFGWSRNVKERGPKPVISIAINTAISAFEESHNLKPRGACAILLADQFEELGYGVEVKILDTSKAISGEVHMLVQTVVVKAAGVPSDTALMAMMCCSPAFRRAFLLMARSRVVPGTVHTGFGTPSSIPEADKKGFDIVIDRDVKSMATAEEFIGKIASKFNMNKD